MEILGYSAAVLIGISLGLIGGGGSILTVPVLVYLFGIDAGLATSYSLFVVGTTSLVGAWKNHTKGFVDIRTALLFGAASITTVLLTRRFLIPLIPNVVYSNANLSISRSMLTMVLFATLMLLASFSMIRGGSKAAPAGAGAPSAPVPLSLLMYGVGIGLVTGLLGAGGGFLLIPALVLLLHMPMKTAVGTSLFIIALNSLIGFTGDLGHVAIQWPFLLTITGIAVAGILAGTWLSKKIPGEKLKKGFGWFVLIMAVYILIKELFFR
jgi:uncharacterized membrane protein YfcA